MCARLSRVSPPENASSPPPPLAPREEKVRLSALRDPRRSVHDHEATTLRTLFINLSFFSSFLSIFCLEKEG